MPTPAARMQRRDARLNSLYRLYLALVFAVIVAIGSFGAVALHRSEQRAEALAASFERANYASRMGTQLDIEQAGVMDTTRRGAALGARFGAAGATFDRLIAAARAAGPAQDVALDELAQRHARFVDDSRRLVRALARGDVRDAEQLRRSRVLPDIEVMDRMLDTISAREMQNNVARRAEQRAFSTRMLTLIVLLTLFALGLLQILAIMLRRNRRAAADARADRVATLEHAALTDNLTGLGNHRAFSADFARELARAKRQGRALTLALIDVDDFKGVNDRAGHSHGDLVLERVGAHLSSLREEDRAYRVGGDEFALLLIDADDDAANTALTRAHEAMRASGLGATLSIGYASLEGDALEMDSYDRADAALYEAKRRGRNTIVSYAQVPGAESPSARTAEALRGMIDGGRLDVAFQPIWDVVSTHPLGFEALTRPDPEFGLAGPQAAFDFAERARKLPQLDAACMRKALVAARDLPPDATLFLNVSPVSLADASFEAPRLVAMLRSAGVRPEHVVIELTERRIDDVAIIAQRAAELRAFGFRIALDDTGSGHAGLEILSKVRFDFVKIDRTLIAGAITSFAARGVLAGIIAIARETGAYLIAEGVESPDMLDFVRNAHVAGDAAFVGIRGVQGYLLGRPHVGRPDAESLEAHQKYLAARVDGAVAAAA